MKKILFYLPVVIMLLDVFPIPAYAALQCGSSFDNYGSFVSTQTKQSCFSDPNTPNAVVYDTSSNTYTLANGQTISKPTGIYRCVERSNTSVVTTVYSSTDCSGDLYDKDGKAITILGTPAATSPAAAPTTPSPASGSALLTYTPLEPLPGGLPSYGGKDAFSQYLGTAFKVLLGLGAMIAIVTLVIGGIGYMISESIGKKILAKERIRASIIGLLLLLGCYLILTTINPALVNLSFQVPGSSASGSGSPSASVAPPPAAPTNEQVLACEGTSGDSIQYAPTGGWSCGTAGLYGNSI